MNAVDVSLVIHVIQIYSWALQSAISEVLYSTDKSQDLIDLVTNPNTFWLTVDEEEHFCLK
jgi:hypothetical protein